MKTIATMVLVLPCYAFSGESYDACKNEILSTRPYGLNAQVNESSTTKLGNYTRHDWIKNSSLVITAKDGEKAASYARCVYDEKTGSIVFFSIYGDTIISKYPEVVKELLIANSVTANDIAKRIGLSEIAIKWIKRNGSRNFISWFNEVDQLKSILIELDSKDIIFMVVDETNPQQFTVTATDVSKLLSQKL